MFGKKIIRRRYKPSYAETKKMKSIARYTYSCLSAESTDIGRQFWGVLTFRGFAFNLVVWPILSSFRLLSFISGVSPVKLLLDKSMVDRGSSPSPPPALPPISLPLEPFQILV